MQIDRSSLFIEHEKIRRKYFCVDQQSVFYHYTCEKGLRGILESGGLHANYRGNMGDTEEFKYARSQYESALNEMAKDNDICNTLRGFAKSLLTNMGLIWDCSAEHANGYCACLTSRRDDRDAWRNHGDNGNGYCLGFHVNEFLLGKRSDALAKLPYFY